MNFGARLYELFGGFSGLVALVAGVLAAMCASCSDPLDESQRIESLRVLGARVEVVGDEQRARPMPEEMTRVRWLLAAPERPTEASWAFEVCPAIDSRFGVPECAGPVFARFEQTTPAAAEPQFEFALPSAAELGGATRLAVLGAVCDRGAVRFDGGVRGAACVDDAAQLTRTSFDVFVAGVAGSDAATLGANDNPDLSGSVVALDGAAWPELSGDAATCDTAGDEVPRVRAGSGEHRIELSLTPAARERLPADEARRDAVETIQVSHLSTAGLFERPFSTILPADDVLDVRVTWEAPDSAPPAGRSVDFYFVIRDLRGGVSWQQRALCVDGQ